VTLHEPAVALSDLALAVLCALLAWRLGPARIRWVVFFAAVGLASLLGSAVHALPDASSGPRASLWRATLLAVGAAAVSGYGLAAAAAGLPARLLRIVDMAALALALPYARATLVAETPDFRLAVLFYLPAVLLLGTAFAWRVVRGAPGGRVGLAGVAVTLTAAFVQRARLDLHPAWLDHNTVYHLVQAAGLYLLFRAAGAPHDAAVRRADPT
jgi:hypothetical protein